MPYKFLEHTADVKMKVWSNNLKDLFNQAFKGLMNCIIPQNPNYSGQIRRLIIFSSNDFANLLIDFLNEILTLSQIYKEIYQKINFIHFPENSHKNLFIEAEIIGQEIDKFAKDIKAITYHNANLIKNEKGEWEITIVFDI